MYMNTKNILNTIYIRYALNSSKLELLGWRQRTSFDEGQALEFSWGPRHALVNML